MEDAGDSRGARSDETPSTVGVGLALFAGLFFGVNFNGGAGRRAGSPSRAARVWSSNPHSATRGAPTPPPHVSQREPGTPHVSQREPGTCVPPTVAAQYVMDRAGTPAYPHASHHALDYVPVRRPCDRPARTPVRRAAAAESDDGGSLHCWRHPRRQNCASRRFSAVRPLAGRPAL
eukprot:890767-Prymnesium_polylepis.1